MYLATLDCATSNPSLSSSPWMRGAPQSGFSMLIRRISARNSVSIRGRPPSLIAQITGAIKAPIRGVSGRFRAKKYGLLLVRHRDFTRHLLAPRIDPQQHGNEGAHQ